MKFREIFRFELAYQVRRPWPWLMFTALFALCFLMTRDDALADALYSDYFVNAPFAIAVTTVVGGLFWLLLAPVVAGEAGARDVATGMYPLTFTSPVSKTDYLGGRFLAAFLINAVMLLAVQLGMLLAVYSPGVKAELIGPFRPAAYLTAYAYIALPNALIGTAMQFSLALRSGRAMAGYLGSMFLVFMGFFVASILLYSRGLGRLLDPIGIRFVVEDLAHVWTTFEKKHRLLAFEGIVLQNRLVWLGAALTVLGITWQRFRFAHRIERSRRWSRSRIAYSPTPARTGVTASVPLTVPQVRRAFGFTAHAQQSLAIARASFRTIAKSWAGLGFLVFIPLLSIVIVIDQMYATGAPLLPTTGQVLKELTGAISNELSRWVIVPLITVFFAGELVWREREASVDEIADASPLPEWVPLSGKLLGLGFVLAAFMAALMIAGIIAQLILGYRDFDVGLYLGILFGLQLPEYLLFAMLALVVHVLVGQKYIGHMVAILLYVLIILAPVFGIEHNMLIYGAGPWWTYTDMRGLGPFIAPWLWFKLYWAAWALLLGVVARLMWVRGRESGLRLRLRRARQRFTGATAWAAALAVALILTLGGFVFYNTNVLNDYLTDAELAERSAEYERRYAQYALAPQPDLTDASLHVEIRPRARQIEVRGTYKLVNRSAAAIDSIHVATVRPGETRAVTFDRPARPVLIDEDHGHRIYALETPLQPGDSMQLDYQVIIAPRGFREGGADVTVVDNGTFFTNALLPAIGYQRSRELLAPMQRSEHGLGARPVIPSLYDADARTDRHAGVNFHAVIGTDEDQVAVAPGALARSWTEDGRRYFEYSADGPIGNEWLFSSARYAVHEARWNDVDIRILYHPEHNRHPARMAQGIQAALAYLTQEIGPYRYGHITVVEVPGDGVGMHADAGMLSHGEGVTLLKTETARSLDFPYAVIGHEMAHQWAIPAAVVEGAPVISESLAWYYAMKLVEHTKGADQLRRMGQWMRKPYPIAPIHRGEPLLRGLDPWMSYRKGPFALFALSEYIGEDAVNAALRRAWGQHQPQSAPLATMLNLYRELQAVTPDSMKYLLHDLFEVNTIWQFRAEGITAKQTQAGAWEVSIPVRARKLLADSTGVQTELKMDEWVPVGVFAEVTNGGPELSAPLYLKMHRIHSGEQTITITVPGKPMLAGIDPFHLLDWEEGEDDNNIDAVLIESPSTNN